MITLKSENGRYIVTIGSEKKEFNTWNAANKYIEYIGANRSFGEKSMWEQMSELKARIAKVDGVIGYQDEAIADAYDYSHVGNYIGCLNTAEKICKHEKMGAWKEISFWKNRKEKNSEVKRGTSKPQNIQEQILELENLVSALEEKSDDIEDAVSDLYFYFDYNKGGVREEKTLKEIREFKKNVALHKKLGARYYHCPKNISVLELEERNHSMLDVSNYCFVEELSKVELEEIIEALSKVKDWNFDEKDIQNIFLDLKEQISSAEARLDCIEEACCDLFYYYEHDENKVATTAKEIIEIIESERIIVGRKTK